MVIIIFTFIIMVFFSAIVSTSFNIISGHLWFVSQAFFSSASVQRRRRTLAAGGLLQEVCAGDVALNCIF